MIEEYFRSIDALLAESPIVREYDIRFDKRGLNKGYIRCVATMQDDSLLHFREFISFAAENVDRMGYTYDYQRADGTLVFRYDNAPHYPDLPNAPHHRHDNGERVTGIQPPDLAMVLDEITMLVNME